jgi:hypothetical protein
MPKPATLDSEEFRATGFDQRTLSFDLHACQAASLPAAQVEQVRGRWVGDGPCRRGWTYRFKVKNNLAKEADGVADLLIDSSTGDTAAGIRVCPDRDACLMCLVQESPRKTSAMTELIELTGLSREELNVGSRLISDEDVERAKPEIRERIRAAVGTPVCGLGRAIGLAEGGQHDYRPSIPFVSQQAACLGVGRLIAKLHGLADTAELDANLVQYDTLIGPNQLNAIKLQPPRLGVILAATDGSIRLKEWL